ncbi:hypothetical protein [Gilvimarinus xylanilyticus]|uniref:Uncharacterized protein n=1 Tax=Gilvimarinus xylanilyticus TaxID=2944139 RepID=A0A9X2HVZ4_9GAMM|nr:hypothetical protein [Gilvimarinus xylanilyticus]MCP8898684.1 hypothetical protein [Gilvimarinus xylanilyticus]
MNFVWQRNPITRVVYARAEKEIKLIALSLILVLLSAVPLMINSLFSIAKPTPPVLVYIFAAGALLAHVGFLIGLLAMIWKNYFRR